MKENKTIEILFGHFLNSAPEGELADTMHRISGEVDAAIEAGDAGKAVESTAEHELAAMRYGFCAGFLAGLKLSGAASGAGQ